MIPSDLSENLIEKKAVYILNKVMVNYIKSLRIAKKPRTKKKNVTNQTVNRSYATVKSIETERFSIKMT